MDTKIIDEIKAKKTTTIKVYRKRKVIHFPNRKKLNDLLVFKIFIYWILFCIE